jgi:hypothetical protein
VGAQRGPQVREKWEIPSQAHRISFQEIPPARPIDRYVLQPAPARRGTFRFRMTSVLALPKIKDQDYFPARLEAQNDPNMALDAIIVITFR